MLRAELPTYRHKKLARQHGQHTTSRVTSGSGLILLLASLSIALGIGLSLMTQHWHWFARSGSLLVVLGIVLTSSQIIENNRRMKHRRYRHDSNFRHDYAEEYQHHTLERAGIVEEQLWLSGMHGLYLMIAGTLIWGLGDLTGELLNWLQLTI